VSVALALSLMCRLEYLGDALPRYNTVLTLVSLNPEEAVAEVTAPHVPQELLVVGDDNELKVALCLPRLDDHVQTLRKTLDVVAVQVGGGLVESDETAVHAKGLGQREANDDAGEDFLACRAAPTHVHLCILLDHAETVVVVALASRGLVVGADQDCVDIRALVRALPELTSDAIHFSHLQGVKLHDGFINGRATLGQVLNGCLCRLHTDVRLAILLLGVLVVQLPLLQ
jgi:hypothetical protein